MSATASGSGDAPRLGRYELGERIGEGGVAEVLRAFVIGAGDFRRPVVIKRIRAELRDHPEVREAFAREARLAQHLHHANVVGALDFGEDDGAPYLVLELVEGCTLQRLMDDAAATSSPIPIEVALHVVLQIGAALQYVHEARDADDVPLGLVHRDVTPNNVLLGRDGAVKLTDFGIARAAALGSDTLPGFIKGTAMYLAPEQAAGRPVDRRADVYALGLVLRRALVGDGPLDGLHPELQAIVEAATEPAVRDRLPSAAELVARLELHRRTAAIGEGLTPLVAMVTATGAPKRRVIALDAALGGMRASETRQVSRPSPPQPAASGGLARLVPVLLVVAIIGAFAWLWIRAPDPVRVIAMEPPAPITTDAAPITTERAPVTIDDAPRAVGPAPERADPPTPSDPARDPATTAAKPRPKPRGRLRINLVPYAQITIDGTPRGDTPFDEALAAGNHAVELYNPDTARRSSLRVTIEPGQPFIITRW